MMHKEGAALYVPFFIVIINGRLMVGDQSACALLTLALETLDIPMKCKCKHSCAWCLLRECYQVHPYHFWYCSDLILIFVD